MQLTGRRIKLRHYKPTDIQAIFEWNQDDATTIFMGRKFRRKRTYEEIERNVINLMNLPPNDSIYFAIADITTDAYIGGIDITSIDEIDKNGVLSIVVAKKEKRNLGIGKEAIKLLLDYIFDIRKLHRIDLQVNSNNLPAIKCYSDLGFRDEGRKREYSKINGEYYDLIHMGLLSREWNYIKHKTGDE